MQPFSRALHSLFEKTIYIAMDIAEEREIKRISASRYVIDANVLDRLVIQNDESREMQRLGLLTSIVWVFATMSQSKKIARSVAENADFIRRLTISNRSQNARRNLNVLEVGINPQIITNWPQLHREPLCLSGRGRDRNISNGCGVLCFVKHPTS